MAVIWKTVVITGVVVDDKPSFVDFVEQKHNMVNARLYQMKCLR